MDRDWRLLGHLELLVQIATKVGGNPALRSMRLVCKQWMEAASLMVLSTTGGNKTASSQGQGEWLTYVQRFPALTAFTYNSTAMIELQGELEGLLQLRCLKYLSVCAGLSATETLFPQLSTLTRLKGLNLQVNTFHFVQGGPVNWNSPESYDQSSLRAVPQHIGALSGLQYLTINYEPISDSNLQPLSALSSLQALTLKGCLFDPSATFVHLPCSLTRLAVDGGMHQSFGFTDSHLANLGRLGLESLTVTDARHLTGKGLRGLLELPGLRSLDLKLSGFGGEHLSVLRALTGLTSLEIASAQTLTQEAMIHIAAVASLEKLRLADGLFTGGSLVGQVHKLSKLTSLDMYNAALGLGRGIDLGFLQQLPALESLSVAACKYLTTGDLLGLRYAQRLRFLNLSCLGEGATDVLMESVGCLHGLTKLILCSSPWFTEEGLACVTPLTNLVSLDLCSCNALQSETVALAVIQRCNLNVLDLSCCGWLTDTGLELISAFEGLAELILTFCPNISVQGISRLFNSQLRLAKLNIASCNLDLRSEPWFDDALSGCEFVGARGC